MGNALIKLSGGPAALDNLVRGSTRLLAAVSESTLADARAERLAAYHASVARAEACKALFWARRDLGTPGDAGRIAHHGRAAGQRMAFAGLPYVLLAIRYPEAAAVPAIWSAVRDGWFAAQDAAVAS